MQPPAIAGTMNLLIFLTFFFAYASTASIFSSVDCSPDAVQVCCYSTSPADYPPNCYPCPTNVYANSLMACINATDMPKNITFKQAICMEKNCQINFPTPPSNGLQKYSYPELFAIINQLFGRQTRSVDSGWATAGAAAPRKKRDASYNVVKQVNTIITSLGNVEFSDNPDYF